MSDEVEMEIDAAIENTKPAKKVDTTEEFTDSDLGGQWIGNPKIGESTEQLTIQRIVKNYNIDARKKDGKAFKTNLSNVDYKIEIHTDKGIFTPGSWEVVGKLKQAMREAKAVGMFEGKKMGEGLVISVAHTLDGMKPENKEKECYKLIWHNSPAGVKEITRD